MNFQEGERCSCLRKPQLTCLPFWKVFANLLGTCQVQLYSSLRREECAYVQGMGTAVTSSAWHHNLHENLPKAIVVDKI